MSEEDLLAALEEVSGLSPPTSRVRNVTRRHQGVSDASIPRPAPEVGGLVAVEEQELRADRPSSVCSLAAAAGVRARAELAAT